MRMLDLLPDYLKAKIVVTDGCWQWSGWHNNLGYGYVRVDGRDRPAHRMVMEVINGSPYPKGIDIDHLCRNPGCVNPEHLEAIPHRDNLRRGKAATKTACKFGHDWTNPANMYIRADGRRWCAECARTRWSRRGKQCRVY